MTTTVTFYEDPTNIDFLIPEVRLRFGDLTGAVYSDTIIRTALISGINMLIPRWNARYQVFRTTLVVNPQPEDVPSGYIQITGIHGFQYVPETLVSGDIFRDNTQVFLQSEISIIESQDIEPVVLAAIYILRRIQFSSSALDFVSWTTEDIRYSNLGGERSLGKLLESDLQALEDYFASKPGKAQIGHYYPAKVKVMY